MATRRKRRGWERWCAAMNVRAANEGVPMPTIKNISGPYRFFFYSFDCNEPVHVHIQRD
jgi:hypothetical protein